MPRSRIAKPLERSLSDEVLYGRPQDHLRVFVSSKMRDGSMGAERVAARDAIDALPWHRSWTWEKDGLPGPYSSLRVCIANAETSDCLVLIVGDDLTWITRREYGAARRGGVARFVFLKDDVQRTAAVERFIKREQRRQTVTGTFQNVAELASLIRAALAAYSVRAHRIAALREREARDG